MKEIDEIKDLQPEEESEENRAYTFSEEDMKQYEDEVNKMNYIELVGAKSKIVKEMENLDSAKAMIDSIRKSGVSPTDPNKNIMEENVMDDADIRKNANQFMEEYDKNKGIMTQMVSCLDEKLNKYGDEVHSSKFLNDEKIAVIKKHIEKAEAIEDPNRRFNVLSKLNMTLSCYENRGDFTEIARKMTLTHSIKKIKSKLYSDRGNKKLFNELCNTYSEETVQSLYKYINECFNDDKQASVLLLCHLWSMAKNEKTRRNGLVAHLFITSILDDIGGIYDIDFVCENKEVHSIKELIAYYYPNYKCIK